MSDYKRITRHPNDGKYYEAEWRDNHFGPHLYGVSFSNDSVVYPAEQVRKIQLATFWADDVIVTLQKQGIDPLTFLQALDATYKARWKRDPAGGEGATKWLQELRGDHDD